VREKPLVVQSVLYQQFMLSRRTQPKRGRKERSSFPPKGLLLPIMEANTITDGIGGGLARADDYRVLRTNLEKAFPNTTILVRQKVNDWWFYLKED
jgi:hypothetical protein